MKKFNSKFDYLFPGIFSLVIFSSVLYWLKLDTNLPHWDMGRHLYHVLKYRELWEQFFSGEKSLAGLITWYMYYPPLVHNIGLAFNYIFGFGQDQSVWSNVVWISILFYSAYFLAKQLFDRQAAVATLLILAASPIIIGQMREFQVDFPLLSIFTLFLFMLYKSVYFKSNKYSVLAGLVFGLGMMTKWSFAFFAVPTGLFYLAYGQYSRKIDWKKSAKNMFIAIFFALVICGLWYYRSFDALRHDFAQNGIRQAAIEGDPYGVNPAAFSWYTKGLINSYLFIPLFIIICAGFISGLINRNYRKRTILITAMFILLYLVISFLPNKDIRYIMPAFIFLALLGGLSTKLSPRPAYGIYVTTIIFLIFLANNIIVPYGKYIDWKGKNTYLEGSRYPLIAEDGYTSNSPKKEVCPMQTIIDNIPIGMTARLAGNSQIDFTDWAVAYYLTKSDRIWAGQQNDYLNSDFLIIRTLGNPQIETDKLAVTDNTTISDSVNCLDGSQVYIYKVNK